MNIKGSVILHINISVLLKYHRIPLLWNEWLTYPCAATFTHGRKSPRSGYNYNIYHWEGVLFVYKQYNRKIAFCSSAGKKKWCRKRACCQTNWLIIDRLKLNMPLKEILCLWLSKPRWRFPTTSQFTPFSPQIICNDYSSWKAHHFDLWPFCGANRVPNIIIPHSLIIFPAAVRQTQPLFSGLCWQVCVFLQIIIVLYIWLHQAVCYN